MLEAAFVFDWTIVRLLACGAGCLIDWVHAAPDLLVPLSTVLRSHGPSGTKRIFTSRAEKTDYQHRRLLVQHLFRVQQSTFDDAPDLRVYWQGPSLGFDFGGDGGRTMMLVYNLPATDAIYQRFVGINGSAYLVGGLGMTALAFDNIVVVPIRSGVGLRLGANVGYLKFTPIATWNPFQARGRDPLAVDLAAHIVTIDGAHVFLTPKEYRMLQLLAQRVGNVVTIRRNHASCSPNSVSDTGSSHRNLRLWLGCRAVMLPVGQALKQRGAREAA